MYLYLELKKVLRNILKSRGDLIDDLRMDKIHCVRDRDVSLYVISDAAACKDVLSSACFAPEDMGSHLDRLLRRHGVESRGLTGFLGSSPLLDVSDGHIDKRIEFNRIIEAILRIVPEIEKDVAAHFDSTPSDGSMTSSELARQYTDLVLLGIFKRLLGTGSLYQNLVRDSGGLFDVFPDPRQIIRLTLAIDEFMSDYPCSDENIPSFIRENPNFWLSLVLMGREPLMGLLATYINGTIRNDKRRLAPPRRVSPVNFIARRCVAGIAVLEHDIRPGDVIYVMLSGANLELDHAYRGLAFGYGPHFCIGYRLAKTLLENFKSNFDLQRWTLTESQPRNEAFLTFGKYHG